MSGPSDAHLLRDPAVIHARWHRALDDPTVESPGPMRDHIEQHDAGIRAKALQQAADAWLHGQWADAPRRPDRVQERIANAQHVGDWLRARADVEGAGS